MNNYVWVLLESYNDYDQHGDYFLAVFKDKPTKDQLLEYGVSQGEADHVLRGGGRIGYENSWYYLRKKEI